MDYTELLKELQEYFADLLIIQYRGAKKNRDLIKLLVNLIFANNLALQIKDLTVNVEESIGAQLDVVGKWVGVDRYYSGELWTHPYLAYPFYSTIQNGTYSEWQGGFSSYSTFNDNNGGFLTYKTWQDIRTTVNKIGDEYFRALIKLKIIKNSINHTCKKIDNAIWNWSNGNVYTTWGNEVFDISKFTVTGTPTITDDGILSDVPSNGYLLSNSTISIDSTGIFSLKGKIFCDNSSTINTYLDLYGSNTFKNIIIRSVQNTYQSQFLVNANGTNQVLTTISSTAGWNDIEVGYNGTNYYYVLNGTKTELTTATTKPDSGSYYLYAGNRGDSLSNNNLSGNRQLDLSSVHINVDGVEVFKGTKTDPMNVTYHYTSLYKDLMTLANYKKILPVPTGCTLILEEITND